MKCFINPWQTSFATTFCVVMVIGLWCTTTFADDPPVSELLAKAWEEYGFQSWSNADDFFNQALADSRATKNQKLQARLGLAFVTNYRTPGYDYDTAITKYKRLLQDAPKKSQTRNLALRSLAKCYYEHPHQPNPKKGKEYLDQLLKNDPELKQLITQDAVLSAMGYFLRSTNRERYQQGIIFADSFLPKFKGRELASNAWHLRALLAEGLADWEGVEKALILQYQAGIQNRSFLEQALFQIARINESKLKNYPKAIEYYRRLYKEVPTSSRAYFAKLRTDELEKGIIKSNISPMPKNAKLPPTSNFKKKRKQ